MKQHLRANEFYLAIMYVFFCAKLKNKAISIPFSKKIFDRFCKPKDSDKHIKKTYLCSSGNELLNFFPLCVFFHTE